MLLCVTFVLLIYYLIIIIIIIITDLYSAFRGCSRNYPEAGVGGNGSFVWRVDA